jgi:hypothetical protein
MFVQVIEGHVADASQMHAALDRWNTELAPGADGWLGSTAGVSEDGRFLLLARFESEDAARRNSDRVEQGQWWSVTSKLFTDEPVFQNSSEVDVDLQGDPNEAGFVQVIRGRTSDPDRARELMGDDSPQWAEFRPDIVGSLGVGHEEGRYTMALYFTSEAEAREGERKETPEELKPLMEEMGSLEVGEPQFVDLRTPWMYSPR